MNRRNECEIREALKRDREIEREATRRVSAEGHKTWQSARASFNRHVKQLRSEGGAR